MNLKLIKTYLAAGDITANSLVKFSADGKVVLASAAGDLIVGVCCQPGGALNGEPVDIQLGGIADVKMAGTVARGTMVTSDSSGLGVAAAPSTGVNNRVIGFANLTTASGDIAEIVMAPGTLQG